MWPYQAQENQFANQWYTYRYDVRGSVTNIVNPAGTVVDGYEYNEFGVTQQVENQGFRNELTFTGSVKDTSTGLQYMNARFYEPQTGRFLSQDTYTGNAYDPWTQHLYAYCANNPVNFIDPTGHEYISAEMLKENDQKHEREREKARKEAQKQAEQVRNAPARKERERLLTRVREKEIQEARKIFQTAPKLDRSTTDSKIVESTNCFGSFTGLQINMNPIGFESGMDSEETYQCVVNTLGNKVRRLNSIDSFVGADEVLAALRCSDVDFHFIVYDRGEVWIDKPGLTAFFETSKSYVTNSEGWDSRYYDRGLNEIRYVGENPINAYNDTNGPIIYIAIKRELIY